MGILGCFSWIAILLVLIMSGVLYQGEKMGLLKEPPPVVEGDVYDAAAMRHSLLPIPKSARNITLYSGLCFTRVRCTVSEADFLALARERKWRLRTDTISYDERTGSTTPDPGWYMREKLDNGRIPTRFYSYNYVKPNNGGTIVLYDRDTNLLLMEYSLN